MPRQGQPQTPATVLTIDVVLEDVEPRIWRRIEVPAIFTFFDLHSAILDAMGWQYPRCVDGARACPPEDVGGPPGYFDFLAAMSDPRHAEHRTMLEWAGGIWDPERFEATAVRFKDPRRRLRQWIAADP
jgi:hypothetical protein